MPPDVSLDVHANSHFPRRLLSFGSEERRVMNQAQLADVMEIEQLLARYAVGMTTDDIDAVIDVFTPDGTYSAFGATYGTARLPRPGGRRAQGPVPHRHASRGARRRPGIRLPDAVLRRPGDARHAYRLVHRLVSSDRARMAPADPGDDVPPAQRVARLGKGPRPDTACAEQRPGRITRTGAKARRGT